MPTEPLFMLRTDQDEVQVYEIQGYNPKDRENVMARMIIMSLVLVK